MKTTIAFALVLAFAAISCGALLASCSVDNAGLGQVDLAPIITPPVHPDAGPAEAPAPPADAASAEATSETAVDRPSADAGEPLRQCAQGSTQAACSSCRAGATDLSALCWAALQCLTTSPPYEITPMPGGPPDPIGYCAQGSQPVATCLKAICP